MANGRRPVLEGGLLDHLHAAYHLDLDILAVQRRAPVAVQAALHRAAAGMEARPELRSPGKRPGLVAAGRYVLEAVPEVDPVVAARLAPVERRSADRQLDRAEPGKLRAVRERAELDVRVVMRPGVAAQVYPGSPRAVVGPVRIGPVNREQRNREAVARRLRQQHPRLRPDGRREGERAAVRALHVHAERPAVVGRARPVAGDPERVPVGRLRHAPEVGIGPGHALGGGEQAAPVVEQHLAQCFRRRRLRFRSAIPAVAGTVRRRPRAEVADEHVVLAARRAENPAGLLRRRAVEYAVDVPRIAAGERARALNIRNEGIALNPAVVDLEACAGNGLEIACVVTPHTDAIDDALHRAAVQIGRQRQIALDIVAVRMRALRIGTGWIVLPLGRHLAPVRRSSRGQARSRGPAAEDHVSLGELPVRVDEDAAGVETIEVVVDKLQDHQRVSALPAEDARVLSAAFKLDGPLPSPGHVGDLQSVGAAGRDVRHPVSRPAAPVHQLHRVAGPGVPGGDRRRQAAGRTLARARRAPAGRRTGATPAASAARQNDGRQQGRDRQ